MSRSEGITVGLEKQPPSVLPVNGVARFEGAILSEATLSDPRINVKITHPDGRVEALQISHRSNGSFDYQVSNLQEGVYSVSFTGVDRRNLTIREFRVENAVRVAQVLEKKITMLDLARRLTERAEQRIRALPVGPNRARAEEMARRLREDTNVAHPATKAFFTKLQDLSLLQNAPSIISQPAMEALSSIAEWAQSTDQEEAEMKAFEERTRAMPSTCDSLDNAAEGLRFVSSISTLILKPLDTVQKTLRDKLGEEVIERASTMTSEPPAAGRPGSPERATFSFIAKRFKSAADSFYSSGTNGVIKGIPGQAREFATFVVDNLFSNYCSVIEGPAKAEFSVYTPEKGKLFYKYKVILEAKLKLWSEKSHL